MFTYAQYTKRDCTLSDYYGQFITERFTKAALESLRFKEMFKRDCVLAGLPVAPFHGGRSSEIERNIALLKRWPDISKKLKETGGTASLAAFSCIASVAVKREGKKWL